MKSPVPFLKSQNYYTAQRTTNVIRDEVINHPVPKPEQQVENKTDINENPEEDNVQLQIKGKRKSN
jgi:hypothetical protein